VACCELDWAMMETALDLDRPDRGRLLRHAVIGPAWIFENIDVFDTPREAAPA
jgi:hypothetical protein